MLLHPNDDTLFNDTLNNKLTKLMFRVWLPTKTLKLFSSPWTAVRWLAHILGTSDCFPTKTGDNNITTSYFIYCEVQSNLDTAPLFSTAMWHYIAGGGKSNYFIVRTSMCVERGAISGFDCSCKYSYSWTLWRIKLKIFVAWSRYMWIIGMAYMNGRWKATKRLNYQPAKEAYQAIKDWNVKTVWKTIIISTEWRVWTDHIILLKDYLRVTNTVNFCTLRIRVSNPRPHVGNPDYKAQKFPVIVTWRYTHTYNKNCTVCYHVGHTSYCDFSRCGLQSSPQWRLWPFSEKKVGHPCLRANT